MDRQGNTYTFIYASVLVVVVAALLAFVSQTLKPIQQKNIEVAKKIDILKSVNVTSTPKDAVEKYEEYIGNNSFILNYEGKKVEGDAFTVEIAKAPFQKQFSGKTIFDDNGKFTSVLVEKGQNSSGNPHAVDAISGGTITSKGVQAMLQDCLSGYVNFLKE